MNICSNAIELVAESSSGSDTRSLAPGDFFCVNGALSGASIRFSSGHSEHYDNARLRKRFPHSNQAMAGHWLIDPTGLHFVSRARYVSRGKKFHPEWF
jgi:hypothetical protein